MGKIILIGGAATIGKSHTARKIAEELKRPWISTDAIRDLMLKTVREEDYPKLFIFSGTTAEEYLTNNSAANIVKHKLEEIEEVWKGVKVIIEEDYVWGSFIIEGEAVLPHLVSKLKNTEDQIIPIFLIDDNIERIRKTVFTRGLWSEAHTYSDDVKEKEVEWVVLFNEYIKKEAKRYGMPMVKITDGQNYLEEIKNIINR